MKNLKQPSFVLYQGFVIAGKTVASLVARPWQRGALQVLSLLALVASPVAAMAEPNLKIQMVAEKEIVVVEDGKQVRKRVPTLEIESGAVLYFTLRIANEGDELATNVVVDNPIPEETHYLEGTAGGAKSEVLFSIDDGQSFSRPEDLVYEFTRFNGEKERRKAKADMYTNVRWVVEDVPPGGQEELFFQVKVN